MSDEYLKSLAADMEKAVDVFKRELIGVRTGRASPGLIENLQVHVHSYGSNMALRELGGIAAPDARLLVVNPWDKGTLQDIERAIATAGLGFNPSNDGQIIRIPIPPLTGERRQALVKVVKKAAEAQGQGVEGVWPWKYCSSTIFPSWSKMKARVLLAARNAYKLSILAWQ